MTNYEKFWRERFLYVQSLHGWNWWKAWLSDWLVAGMVAGVFMVPAITVTLLACWLSNK